MGTCNRLLIGGAEQLSYNKELQVVVVEPETGDNVAKAKRFKVVMTRPLV